MAEITVGIPAYKTTFLVQAVSSALAQTFTDFELLISDDSPDGAVTDLIRRFQDPRIRLIQGPRQGLVPNSVHVWENASADLLKFLYDDDLLHPAALAELLQLIRKDPSYTFAFCRREVIDEYGRVIQRPLGFETDGWMWFEKPAIAEYLVSRIFNPVGEPSNMLIRRSAFPDASCLSAYAGLPIRHLIDVAFMMNAAERGPAVASGKFLASLRQHAEQTSSRTRAAAFSRGLFEWEICLRGAVQRGVVPPLAALRGVEKLQQLYRRFGQRFGEIRLLARRLPALAEQLRGGVGETLTEQFLDDLRAAEMLIDARAQAASSGTAAASPAPQPVSATRVKGRVDHLTRRQARGWAWIPEMPEERLRVEAVVGERVVGHATADLHRPDLADWNMGAANYGFEMSFYRPLLTEEAPRFRVVSGAEEWLEGEFKLPLLEAKRSPAGEGAEAVLSELARFTAPGPGFEEFDWNALADKPKHLDGPDPLLVAFYLPQFHPIPENDAFWGEGFTEWRQLARAAPRFPGHYQPRIPRDLGFYDLRDVEVIRRQAQMAQAAGIGAFGFYYYWFNRKRVLETPVERFLNSDIDMPFLLIWANENWTRAWDGSDECVLLKQEYKDSDEDALLADLARHMLDARYVRIAGRPLFVIYNPGSIPDASRTIARWREKWLTTHGLRPWVLMAQTFGCEDPRNHGLDGALEFPPHKLGRYAPSQDVLDNFERNFSSQVVAYEQFVQASLAEPSPAFPLVKTVVPGWDNEPRRPGRGFLLEGSSPATYQAWLTALLERAAERPFHGTPIVAINAWNEWAEGAYLEPDVHFGSAYLNATARAVKRQITRRRTAGAVRRAKSAATMDKLLLIGMPRTGSTLIQTTLAQHTSIKMYGELFHWVASEREGRHAIVDGLGARAYQPEEEDAIDFLWENVWNERNAAYKAVGFKLFAEYVDGEGTRQLFGRINENFSPLKVINIWRENLLDTLVSRKVAERSGEWVRPVGSTPTEVAGTIRICPAEAGEFFLKYTNAFNALKEFTDSVRGISVEYMDLVSGFDDVMRALYGFIGVDPLPASASTEKQSAVPARYQVENWSDLKNHFVGTQFERHFNG